MKKFLVFVMIMTGLTAGVYYGATTMNFSVLEEAEDFSDWVKLSDIYEKRVYSSVREEAEIKVAVYKMPLQAVEVALHASLPPKSFLEWEEEYEADLLINSGYFLEDFSPTGALYILGEQASSRMLDVDRTGLLYLENGKLELVDTTGFENLEAFQNARSSYLQSYPFLINNGDPSIKEDSQLIARRTVVATTKNNDLLVILVDQTPVSLFELMEILLNETDLEIDMALNLDGGPSSGLISRINEHEESFYPLASIPQILTISRRLQD